VLGFYLISVVLYKLANIAWSFCSLKPKQALYKQWLVYMLVNFDFGMITYNYVK